jgi:hypothetical protein
MAEVMTLDEIVAQCVREGITDVPTIARRCAAKFDEERPGMLLPEQFTIGVARVLERIAK